jgi:hypothetical protein
LQTDPVALRTIGQLDYRQTRITWAGEIKLACVKGVTRPLRIYDEVLINGFPWELIAIEANWSPGATVVVNYTARPKQEYPFVVNIEGAAFYDPEGKERD